MISPGPRQSEPKVSDRFRFELRVYQGVSQSDGTVPRVLFEQYTEILAGKKHKVGRAQIPFDSR